LEHNEEWIISSSNRTLKSGIRELYQSRAVLFALVRRELKSRYRGSFLGFAWVLGKPLSMLLVFSLIIGEILGASRSIPYFAIYIFVSLMFWGFFAESTLSATNSIVNAAGLVQKISFPREILPITSVVVAFVNTIIQVPVLVLGYLLFNKWPKLDGLINLFPVLLILALITLGLSLILSALNVYVRDVQPLTELAVMLLMYTTPILYSWTFVKEKVIQVFESTLLFDIYIHNPLTVVIVGVQDSLWPGKRLILGEQSSNTLYTVASPVVWIIFTISLLFLLASYKVFLRLEPNFAREL